jgi:glycosyltransferase involved in cell wall biosynthesis
MKITMLLSNAFRPDPRVAREAAGLAEAGYEINIIAWDRPGQLPLVETRDGYHIERLQGVRTVYGAGLRQLLSTPRFWMEAVRRIRISPPAVIHCHDLDTLPAGWWIKRNTGGKLIYDAHENYPAMMSLYLPSLAVTALSSLERFLIKSVDHIITASSVLADEYNRQGFQQITTIGNYQGLDLYESIGLEHISQAREALNLKDQDLVIAYIGGFSRNRLIIPLIQAVDGMEGVQALIWGDGHQRRAVEHMVAKVRNARYMGWLPEEQVALYTRMADMIYYCLVSDYAGAVYNAPNTLSNAMAAGRPIIANDVGDLGRIVRQTGCGVLLEDNSPESIRLAIDSLRSEALRHKLGLAGRQAAEREFNWANAKQRLVAVYDQLQA